MNELRGINTNLSYFTLRRVIGVLGLLLPGLAPLVACEYLESISHSYYTVSGVLFVGILTLCGAFLCSYRGYEMEDEKLSDNVITWIGGVAIILVALVPTPFAEPGNCPKIGPTPIFHCSNAWGGVHFGSAVLFFICMAHMSFFRFTKGDEPFDAGKKLRNIIYKVCGVGMWLTLVVAAYLLFVMMPDDSGHTVFWVEVVLLIFFGTSWLVKGKGLVAIGLQKDDK